MHDDDDELCNRSTRLYVIGASSVRDERGKLKVFFDCLCESCSKGKLQVREWQRSPVR